jgi:hypothetical protein
MAQIVNEPLRLRRAGERRTYTRIPWESFANGDVWALRRGEDWNAKTSQQVVEMAKRFADREGYELHFEKTDDVVWVRFLKELGAQVNPFAPQVQSFS